MSDDVPPKHTTSLRQRLNRPFVRRKSEERQTFLIKYPSKVYTGRLEATGSLAINLNLSYDTRRLLTRAITSSKVFYALADKDVTSLVNCLKFYEIGANETIYEQGVPPTHFYVLYEGKVVKRSNGKDTGTILPGQSFGSTALLHGHPRDHTVVTLECCSFFTLELENFTHYVKLTQTRNYETLRNFNYTLKQLEGLPAQYIDALSKFAVLEQYRLGDKVVTEGESGSVLYFIFEGSAVVTVDDEEVRRLFPGDCFGEQALLYDGIRTATVSAVSQLRCEAIPKQVLYRLFGVNLDDFIYTNTARIAFDKNPALNFLGSSEKERLIESMTINTYGYDEVVISAGTQLGKTLWIVLNGNLCTRQGLSSRESESFAALYECIGADEVHAGFSDSVFETDIVADSDEVAIGEISHSEFNACFDLPSSQAKSLSTRQFKGIQILEELPREKQQALVKMLEVRLYQDREVICQQNTPGDYFYILKSGRAVIEKDRTVIRTVTKSDYFGEKALLLGQPRTATIYAEGRCVCWLLNKTNFDSIFDQRMKSAMGNRIERTDVTVALEELCPVLCLGKGQFGCVYLVATNNNDMYALKAIDRRKVNTGEQCEYVLMERNVLMQINHKFIMKLIKTFKDSHYLYFLLEFIKGATLFEVLHESGHFTIPESTFYLAIILQILEYLHERDIVHRDLKPENIMVTESGYLKLIDFGTAKVVHGRTYTRLGTAWYMAPEVLTNKGYGLAVDLWSAGVMFYEFVCGRVPFGEEVEDPYIVLKQIVDEEVVFPGFMKEHPECKSLISLLLNKNPTQRSNIHDIKKHKLFRNFDWNALMMGTLTPPRIPTNKKNLQQILKISKRNHSSLHKAFQVIYKKG